MTVNKILKKYSKEVIIEWITNKYPLFMNKNLEEELEGVKNDLEFDKAYKELETLFKKQKELDKKPFIRSNKYYSKRIRSCRQYFVSTLAIKIF